MFERLPMSGSEFTPVKDNLRIKFGPSWQNASATLAHRRLRSWGMNTMASWPDLGIASGQLGAAASALCYPIALRLACATATH